MAEKLINIVNMTTEYFFYFFNFFFQGFYFFSVGLFCYDKRHMNYSTC